VKLFRSVPMGERIPAWVPCHRGFRNAPVVSSWFVRIPLLPVYRHRYYEINADELWRGVTVWSVLFSLDHMRGGCALRIMLGENIWRRFAWQIATSP